jgi:hypothetical protein
MEDKTMAPIDKKIINQIAIAEAKAIKDGLQNPEMRKNPAFLEKVRKFLAQNKFVVAEETEALQYIKDTVRGGFPLDEEDFRELN